MAPAPELRRRLALAVLLLAALALPPVLAALGQGYYVGFAARVLIMAMAALSLDLVMGLGGMVSFGHAAFLGIGAYVVGIGSWHVFEGVPLPFGLAGSENALVVWPLAMLAAGLAALGIGAVSLRTTGIHFIMITLAFAQMLFYLAGGLKTYGGDDGITLYSRSSLGGLNLSDPFTFYYLCLGLLAAVLAAFLRLADSRFGMVLKGVRDNERRMRALGFPTYRYKLAAFTLSGAVCGLAGALLANASEFAGPAYMGWQRSGELLVMVVLGGMGSLVGAVLGAAALLILEEALAGLTQHWQLLLGALLLLLALSARRGLWGWLGGGGRHG
ncbi:branched-chain amino acid ABC transporter permease [Magnetospirillum sp. UT-4]|uniref:branched-chain amino acid ABC transporter permease n=1 Tax=Magnetospirillum sp. UT-4 TaxID=2681467 RepID=UPI001384273A|nr:branched-chain amino acid ABC transporter permease [Magnetospirillum sp. UT-4]CAA7627029.1 putative High-affinity branched-chain amino acid transport system permease protein livM [Magnetospirillum sp. UT-4]